MSDTLTSEPLNADATTSGGSFATVAPTHSRSITAPEAADEAAEEMPEDPRPLPKKTRTVVPGRENFDGDAAIIANEFMARKLARDFRSKRKYPVESVELEAEALLALTESARDWPFDPCFLPLFGPYAAQRITWRLEDFIQRWYRLSRRDYDAGLTESRRIVELTATEDARPVGVRGQVDDADPNAGLYAEDCRRLVEAVLTPRQKEVVMLRYTERLSLKAIGRRLGMTHLRTRQVHCDAVAALRLAMGENEIDHWNKMARRATIFRNPDDCEVNEQEPRREFCQVGD
jgi:hypothetical protein